MDQAKKYYAIYTGEGDGIIIHSTWNNIESAVKELLKNNPKAKQYSFDKEEDAKKFAKHGFDEKATALLLENMRLNRKIDQDLAALLENEVIAFIAGSYTKRENQVGYGALIFTNQGAKMPKELCGLVDDTQGKHELAGQLEATKQVINWATNHDKTNITIYYSDSETDNFEEKITKEIKHIKVNFYKITGNHVTHQNEVKHVARAGAQGIEKN
ncbi:viroplasmin family protein [Lactobacillus sp.]|uniref:ribonuclease H1 domain-containing protein n=1 Tax=Lactobacillus sp. TaxID=1591 RepID=UPI0019CD9BC7|nr:viroplasmin family protein [Lactobacillus sp.]MBD5429258.1 hypothetical protein [Lactobacillus sp.]